MSGTHELHHERGHKASNSKETLCHSKKIRPVRLRRAGADLLDVVDEEIGNGDLRAHVAELSDDAPEQRVLFSEWFVVVACFEGCALGLAICHVRVSDFRNGREIKDDCETEDEGSDAEVGVLY